MTTVKVRRRVYGKRACMVNMNYGGLNKAIETQWPRGQSVTIGTQNMCMQEMYSEKYSHELPYWVID